MYRKVLTGRSYFNDKVVETKIKQQCKSGWFWKTRDLCWNEILIILSCLRWKGIRKRALGLWPAGGPVRAFWDQKGLNYGAVSPELSPPPSLHMCTPGWRFGFTLCTDTLLALLKTSVRLSVSLVFYINSVSCDLIYFCAYPIDRFTGWAMFSTWIRQIYHFTSDTSGETKF